MINPLLTCQLLLQYHNTCKTNLLPLPITYIIKENKSKIERIQFSKKKLNQVITSRGTSFSLLNIAVFK